MIEKIIFFIEKKRKTKNACNFTRMRFLFCFIKTGCVLLYDDFIRK